MLKEAPKPTAEQLALIDKLEKEADACRKREQESFERSDTDGFLSQWAMSMSARKADLQIEILKNGGHAQFLVLVDKDDNVVSTEMVSFKNKYTFSYDTFWKVDKDRYGRRWIPIGRRSRIQKQLGLREDHRWFPAYAAIAGSGTGLSGCASAYVTSKKKQNGEDYKY